MNIEELAWCILYPKVMPRYALTESRVEYKPLEFLNDSKFHVSQSGSGQSYSKFLILKKVDYEKEK